MQSTDDKVIAKIKKAKRGSLFFTEDFLTFGTSKTIATPLNALVVCSRTTFFTTPVASPSRSENRPSQTKKSGIRPMRKSWSALRAILWFCKRNKFITLNQHPNR